MENAIENYPMCPNFQAMQPKDKILSCALQGRPCESVTADIFSINIKHYLFIVDDNSKFPVINQVKVFSTYNLIKHVRSL